MWMRLLESDLLWLWGGDAEADLGRHGVALEPSIRGERDPGPGDRAIEAAGRARRIEAALSALSHEQQRVLRAAHSPMPPGLRVARVFLGEMAAVVLAERAGDLGAAYELAEVLTAAQRRGKAHQVSRDAARARLASWKASAAVRVAKAVSAYREQRSAARARDRAARTARERARARARREWVSERVFGRVA